MYVPVLSMRITYIFSKNMLLLMLGLLLALAVPHGVKAYGFGSPGCVTSPNHFADPQTIPCPYNVTIT
jgi:hypothetical protein